jgi:hypothetical protein
LIDTIVFGAARRDVATGLSAAALVLALASRGDAIVIGVALVAATARPVALGAVLPALVASSWRWGSTSLEALAGNQAVLGPAGWVGPRSAAMGAWLAAAALVLGLAPVASRHVPAHVHSPRWADLLRPRPLVEVALAGVLAADVVAGPAPGGELAVRVGASIGLAVLALGVSRVRHRRRWLSRAFDGAAVAGAIGALVAVSSSAPAWTGAVIGASTTDSLALGAAVVALFAAARLTAQAGRGTRWSLRSRPL